MKTEDMSAFEILKKRKEVLRAMDVETNPGKKDLLDSQAMDLLEKSQSAGRLTAEDLYALSCQ